MNQNLLPSIKDVMDGRAFFPGNMPVWFAKFSDNTWPFIDPNSPLYAGKTTSAFVWNDYIHGAGYTFKHWNSQTKNKYDYCLTEEIVADLKISTAIYAFFPKLLKDSRSGKSAIEAITVKGRVGTLVNFFSFVLRYYENVMGYKIKSLHEISFDVLKICIAKFDGPGDALRRALKMISDPIIQKNLSRPLQWQLLDITSKSLAFSPRISLGGIPTMTDDQFTFLISYCRTSIRNFKTALAMSLRDQDIAKIPDYENGALLEATNKYYADSNKYDAVENKKPVDHRAFSKKFEVATSELSKILADAHSAAMMTIFLLTGMRLSETKFLMRDCLSEEHGYFFLKSKVVKHQPKDTPIAEGWLAVDLVVDAYEILQFFCEKTGSKYLFSSPKWIDNQKRKVGYAAGVFNQHFSRWIKRIDSHNLFKDWAFSVHQCRETLVYQLARQEVGIPFISMQLKHFHSKFNSMPNQVTAGYGNYRTELLSGIAKRKAEAKEQALLEVYGEDSKFAGGGAEAHKTRIDTFFKGMGLFGIDRENYIKKMAIRGAKLMPTSIGSCTKNFLITKEGELPPPCYGDFQCDPDCQNHVISKSCANALTTRSEYAKHQAANETNEHFKVVWIGLADKLDNHIAKLDNTLRESNGE